MKTHNLDGTVYLIEYFKLDIDMVIFNNYFKHPKLVTRWVSSIIFRTKEIIRIC